ncbi:MAG: hypothetical protein KC415_16375, partial [Anaerolineales bacterium]|nr:hypothetical protein [Anaerolineales bacterium]
MKSRLLAITLPLLVGTAVLTGLFLISQAPATAVAASTMQAHTATAAGDTIRASVGGQALDPAFGGLGYVLSDLSNGYSVANDMVQQPNDDKLVVVGSANHTPNALAIVRYNPDGSLDASFGVDGTVIDPRANVANGVAIQQDNSIVIAGTWFNGQNNDIVVARFLPDGTPDGSFGDNGFTIFDLGLSNEEGQALVIDPAGRILIAGTTDNVTGVQDFIVVALDVDGNPDPTFGLGGFTITDFNAAADIAYDIIFDGAGNILVAGSSNLVFDANFGVARYTSDGALDPLFSSDGLVTINFGNFDEAAYGIALNDTQIVLAGYTGSFSDVALAQLNDDGSLDINFGSGGLTQNDLTGYYEIVHDVAVLPSGEIVVTGFFDNFNTADFFVARYISTGFLDDSFGGGIGYVQTDIAGGYDTANALVVQPGGELVVAGQGGTNIALARYATDGTPDPNFDDDGKVLTPLGNGPDSAKALALQDDGKVVVASYATDPNGLALFAINRMNSDGSPDNGFGINGVAYVDFAGLTEDQVHAVAVQPDGKILLGGASVNQNYDSYFALARLNEDGTPDTTFGSGGVITHSVLLSYPHDSLSDLTVLADGRIIAVGYSSDSGGEVSFPTILGYRSNGDLDTAFGNGGQIIITDGFGGEATAVAVQPDGKIVVGGYLSNSSDDFMLLRLNEDGSFDSQFGDGGIVNTDVYSGYDIINDVLIQPDGKILVAGEVSRSDYMGSYFGIARYNNDGSLDTTFGPEISAPLPQRGSEAVLQSSGVVTASFGGDWAWAYAVMLRPNGRILAAGSTYDASGISTYMALAQFTPDGFLDHSYASSGKALLDIGNSTSFAYDAVLQPDGLVLLAGGTDVDTAVARFGVTGLEGNGNANNPAISANGRFVAFISTANDLVVNDTNDAADVFVYDMLTGQTTRVSVDSNGVQANGPSYDVDISADGRFVVFTSAATNLSSGQQLFAGGLYIHDRLTGKTFWPTITVDSAEPTQVSPFDQVAVSASGRYIAFNSLAANIVLSDTNGMYDVFVYDDLTKQTTRVSVHTNGNQGDSDSMAPDISADGRFVTFISFAGTLVDNDNNDVSDAFVHDRQLGQTSRVSVNSNGVEGNDWTGIEINYEKAAISDDGRYITFES